MKVALTFDAELAGREHADAHAAHRILNTLHEHKVRTTWFLQGRWCRYSLVTAATVEVRGHLIGNHSMFHAPLPMLSDQGLRDDVALAEAEIHKATGVLPRPWFRAPNLAVDARVEETLSDLGYWHVGADVLSMDWEPDVSVDELTERVVTGALTSGPVVLLHSWPATTAAALPAILATLLAEGVEFVTVEEL